MKQLLKWTIKTITFPFWCLMKMGEMLLWSIVWLGDLVFWAWDKESLD